MEGDISATSSRKTVPPWAISNSPFLSVKAPVKAPRLWPNSSLLSSVSGMPPQFWVTKRSFFSGAVEMDAPRHDLFTGARLPLDQNGNVGIHYPLAEPVHIHHAVAVSDDLVESVPLLDRFSKTDIFLLRSLDQSVLCSVLDLKRLVGFFKFGIHSGVIQSHGHDGGNG